MATNANVRGGAASHGASLSGLNAPVDLGTDYIDSAVAQLNAGHIAAVGGATLDSQGQINSGLNNGVGVVALPSDMPSTLSDQEIANLIAAKAHYKTVIVTIQGKTTVGIGGSASNSTALQTTLNSEIGSGVTPGKAIAGHLKEVNQAAAGQAGQVVPGGTPAALVNSAVGFGGGLVGILVIAGVTAFIVNKVKSSHRTAVVKTTGSQQVYMTATKFSKYLPEKLAALTRQLDDLGRKHSQVDNDHLTPQIAYIVNNVQELFNRIHKQSGDSGNNAKLAEVEYLDKFKKLNDALGEDYYLDIAAKPNLWDSPEERLKAVDDAVDAVNYQLVENIKQVNASKDLKFQVALDSLMASKAPTVNDIYESKRKPLTGNNKNPNPTIS